MTTIAPPRSRRSAFAALGGSFIVAGSLLLGAPVAGAEPSAEAVDAIDDRYAAFGGESSLLGAPVSGAVDVPGGAAREYQGGTIYFSEDSGAHVMYGAILQRYRALGGPGSDLGFPTNDESDAGDGTGRFNDFSAPEGAAIYWTPQWGASVIKGRVLEAWRQSGAVTGPFGYPTADTSIADGLQTGKFVGPEGTEIQWSQAAGLVTVPAALAARIPGFGASAPTAEGTTTVTRPTVAAPSAPDTSGSGFKWWWIPIAVALAAGLFGLLRLLRKPSVEPVKVAAPRVEVPKPAVKAPAPAPVEKVAPPPPPPRPAAKPPAPPAPRPPAPRPVAKTPPPAPKPVTPPPPPRLAEVKEHVREEIAEVKERVRGEVTELKAEVRETFSREDDGPIVRYASTGEADTGIQVTYENNAVDGKASRADKSDLTPDHLQE